MQKPFVSVITPTKDRLPFLENILRNFYRQDYPLNRMELLIGDDSYESMKDYIPDKKEIKYYYLKNMNIGEKRNYLCNIAKGDIIVFMDDDDYYPKQRVSHAVSNLFNCNIVGCSVINVYYTNLDKIYKFGPYDKYHATCGTLAFTKQFFDQNKFNSKDLKAEETFFLKNFKIKLKQLDTNKTILCMAHISNTVDKHKFINDKYLTNKILNDFVLEDIDLKFYKSIYKNQYTIN